LIKLSTDKKWDGAVKAKTEDARLDSGAEFLLLNKFY